MFVFAWCWDFYCGCDFDIVVFDDGLAVFYFVVSKVYL